MIQKNIVHSDSGGVAPVIDNIRRWDELAAELDSSFPVERLGLLRHFQPSSYLLDYGCGKGRVISFLTNHGFKNVTGCDSSPQMCLASRKANPQTRIILTEEANVSPLAEESLDGAILVGVLSSVIPHLERKELIGRLARCVRRGGKLVVGDFGCSTNQFYRRRYESCSVEARTFRTAEGLWIHHFLLSELIELVAGFFAVEEADTCEARTVHGRIIPGYVIAARRL